MNSYRAKKEAERWDIYEIILQGPEPENPFKEVEIDVIFTHQKKTVKVGGFFDGEGTYRVRMMPEELGKWEYVLSSNIPELDGVSGEFICIDASKDNHGPVRVAKKHHFSYADGTPFFVMGTTAYTWAYRSEEIRI